MYMKSMPSRTENKYIEAVPKKPNSGGTQTM